MPSEPRVPIPGEVWGKDDPTQWLLIQPPSKFSGGGYVVRGFGLSGVTFIDKAKMDNFIAAGAICITDRLDLQSRLTDDERKAADRHTRGDTAYPDDVWILAKLSLRLLAEERP